MQHRRFISKQKIFNKLVDKRREKITDLDKRVNSDDLIYRYKGNTADVKLDKFDKYHKLLNIKYYKYYKFDKYYQ